MDLQDGDLAARANFCTIKDGLVTDRRAGRIPTEETERLCALITEKIPEVEGVQVIIKARESLTGLRFDIAGKELSDKLTDADPHKDNKPFAYAAAKPKEADFAAQVVNYFYEKGP